jgi:hypothetical protein
MKDSHLTPEAESLIQGYVEGELTGPECVRLGELLHASPSLITPILLSLQTEALIRQTVLQTATPGLGTGSNVAEAFIGQAGSTRLRGRVVGAALAACLVLTALGAILWQRGASHFMKTGSMERGTLLYEFWSNITGSAIVDLTSHPAFERPPTGSQLLREFKAPSRRAENYGARVRAYLLPPLTGDYIFWIAADDAGELWLSPNENPANRKRICSQEFWAPPGDWTRQPSQQSQPIRLEAGRCYYIEALHKQGVGDDSLAVAWEPPKGKREIIPGSALSPFPQRPNESP